MEFRTVPGNRGLAWFQGGVRMLDRNPRGLIAVSLGLVLLSQLSNLLVAVPMLSILVWVLFLLLAPALFAGLLHAIGEAYEGRPVAVAHLFEGLAKPGARAHLLGMGVVTLVSVMLALLAMQRILGPEGVKVVVQISLQQIKPDSPQVQAVMPTLLKAVGAALAILFVLVSMLFFAVPRVMFDHRRAPGSMLESLAACAANVLPLTLYGLVTGGAGFVALMALGIVGGMLGLLGQGGALVFYALFIALVVVMVLVNASGTYLAWRDVFAHVHGDAPPRAGIIV